MFSLKYNWKLLQNYRDRRMLFVLFLGMVQGFPWVAIGSGLTLWLREAGISRSEVAFLTGIGTAYALNLLWAPIIDAFRLPLAARIGKRRSWVLLCLIVIAITLLVLGEYGNLTTDYTGNLHYWMALAGLVIAFSGATADVALDAMRIEYFDETETTKIGPAAAMITSGWWLSYGFIGAILLVGVESLQNAGFGIDAWNIGYTFLAGFALLLGVIVVLLPDPKSAFLKAEANDQTTALGGSPPDLIPANRPWQIFLLPIKDFFTRFGVPTALAILASIFLFKSGEAYLGRMSLIFYDDIGLSKSQIAIGSKVAGPIVTVIFAIIGSLINARFGLLRGIFISGILMASTNVLFSILALIGPSQGFYLFAVVADQMTSAFATVAFVAFISQLCSREHTATHYAALASLGNLARTTLASGSGWTLEHLLNESWFWFFIITSLMVLPSLLVFYMLRHKLGQILNPEKMASEP